MALELRHLEHFVAVAEERNFTRAARRLHIVQSGLSVSIKSLERELGSTLLTRTTTKVALTAAGEALLPAARRTLAAAAAARDAVAEVEGVVRGSLAIGSLQMLFAFDVAELLARFHLGHPGVRVRLRYAGGGSAELAEGVRSGALDLAFLSLPADQAGGLRLQPVAAERLALVCPPGHRLAGRREVVLGEIAAEDFIDFPLGWGTRAAVDRAFGGAARLVDLEVNGVEMMLDLVAHGMGLGFAPRSLAERHRQLAFVPTVPEPVLEISVATAADRPVAPAARRLLELVGRRPVSEQRSPAGAGPLAGGRAL